MNSPLPVAGARRVVVKLGTAVLMAEEGGIALGRFYSLVESLTRLRHAGKEILLVTSGAIGLGSQKLKLGKPEQLPLKQACAAVGQGELMSLYAEAFGRFGITTAQILLTEEDFSNRTRYLNLRNTIGKLLDLKVLPIINENDTVSTAELESRVPGYRKINFGDNDKLSSLVAGKMGADLLILLTDVDGLHTNNPKKGDASFIPVVNEITREMEKMAESSQGGAGRGGMKTKLEAARMATYSGCATLIANGKTPEILDRLFAGEKQGTLFLPKPGLRGRKRWIAFATSVKAALRVNEGARRALLGKKASLLAPGVTRVEGDFERGDVVSLLDEAGEEFARGIVNYSSGEARKLLGAHEKVREIIHRDNMAFLEGSLHD